MSVPSLPRSLASRWFLLMLTATLVTGEHEQCGKSTICGYGARCVSDSGECECSSDGDRLLTRQVTPYSVFYCLGEGVTDCGIGLCGLGTVCNGMGGCRCSSNKGILRKLKDTYPFLGYCVEACSLSNRSCPANTSCMKSLDENMYQCNCLPGTTRSSTGQCLASPITSSAAPVTVASAFPVTTTVIDPNQKTSVHSDCNALTVGLAVGLGEALCVTVIVVVILVIRRHRCLTLRVSRYTQGSVLHNTNPKGNVSTAEMRHSYENVVSSTSPGKSKSVNRDGTRVQVETERDLDGTYLHPVHNDDHNSPNPYEDVRAFSPSPYNKDIGRHLYESANTPDMSGTRLYTTMRQT